MEKIMGEKGYAEPQPIEPVKIHIENDLKVKLIRYIYKGKFTEKRVHLGYQ